MLGGSSGTHWWLAVSRQGEHQRVVNELQLSVVDLRESLESRIISLEADLSETRSKVRQRCHSIH